MMEKVAGAGEEDRGAGYYATVIKGKKAREELRRQFGRCAMMKTRAKTSRPLLCGPVFHYVRGIFFHTCLEESY